jgi:FixJ family two-component response regulator
MVIEQLRLAVVDDDPDVRVALIRLLWSAGFVAEPFESGEQFLQSVGGELIDCVVLDLQMPDLNGFEVQRQLAERNPGTAVVVITGHDTAEARRRASNLGAAAFLSKPVDSDALLLAIREAIHR